MTKHRRASRPRTSPYYASQQFTGQAGFGDGRARLGYPGSPR
jgi:hypothetical protein